MYCLLKIGWYMRTIYFTIFERKMCYDIVTNRFQNGETAPETVRVV